MDYLLLSVLLGIVPQTYFAYEIGQRQAFVCQGAAIDVSESQCPLDRDGKDTVLEIKSITVYSSTNTTMIEILGPNCRLGSPHHQCMRRIGSFTDSGLSADYKYLYEWVSNKCAGRNVCDSFEVPEWWNLLGVATTAIGGSRECPLDEKKYFTGIYVDFSCRANENAISTVTPPPDTTPRTRPTTPTTTTSFPVAYFVYIPGLEPREKIILGIAIGLAVAILIVLLLILYCWERWRKQKKFGKLLRMLGRPQEKEDEFDELQNYGTPDAWRDETNNADALGEYSGVKPDEFLTIDRNQMERSGLIYNDSISTMGRYNTASTLTKNGGYNNYKPGIQVDAGGYTGPIDYETEENLELERRMAAAMGDDEEVPDSKHTEETSRH